MIRFVLLLNEKDEIITYKNLFKASNPNHVKQATSSNLIQMEFSKPEEYNPSDKRYNVALF